MFDPEATTRGATHATLPAGFTAGDVSPHALQILTTEHWSLLSSRSMGYAEAMSRAGLFIASLSGAVVALALVAQATDFGDGFVAFALVLLPVVFFVGAVTIMRLSQINYEDALWVQGLNRLRHAYLELAPELEPYFVTSSYDDVRGVIASAPRSKARTPFQSLMSSPGLIAVLDSVVAGATTGIAALGVGLGTGATIAAGVAGFAITVVVFAVLGARAIRRHQADLAPRFPTPRSER